MTIEEFVGKWGSKPRVFEAAQKNVVPLWVLRHDGDEFDRQVAQCLLDADELAKQSYIEATRNGLDCLPIIQWLSRGGWVGNRTSHPGADYFAYRINPEWSIPNSQKGFQWFWGEPRNIKYRCVECGSEWVVSYPSSFLPRCSYCHHTACRIVGVEVVIPQDQNVLDK